jgi:two-component system, OmpR family, aerobic respiration control sensor histidine kinase ArcB
MEKIIDKTNYINAVFLKKITESLPQYIFWKDENSIYLGCNQNFAKLVGLNSPQEIIGKTDYDLNWQSTGHTAEAFREGDKETLAGKFLTNQEEILVLPGGKRVITLVSKQPILDKGKSIGIVGYFTDITGLRKAEDELKQTTQKLENVLDTIPGHVYWKDKNGAYLGCNNQQAKTFGLSKKEVIGKTDYELLWKESADFLRKIDLTVMKSGEAVTVEEPCINNTIFLSRKAPLYDLQDKNKIIGILGVSFDITNQKLTEKELTETKHKLEGMTIVGASIAHELRTPLMSLQFGISNLRSDLSELSELLSKTENSKRGEEILSSTRDTLDAMEREINLSSLTIDLLLENVKPSIRVKEGQFSMKECVNNALSRYPFKGEQKSWIHWEPSVDFWVSGKELLFSHVLFNLLKNALYFVAKVNKGGIFIELKAGESYNYLYFKDTGAGISPENLSHIFDRFFSQTSHGAGIGLAYCKMVVESLGGNIECESVEGEYTLFKIALPNIEH